MQEFNVLNYGKMLAKKCVILRKGYISLLFARVRGCKICVYRDKILILHPFLVMILWKMAMKS